MAKKPKKTLLFKLKEGSYTLTLLIIAGLLGILPLFEPKIQEAKADLEEISPWAATEGLDQELLLLQENSLLPSSNPANPEPRVVRKIGVVITAYSSSVWETDESPDITAAGTLVRNGIVANNMLPFGTKIRIPEIYGDEIFVVEDRMNWTKSNYHIDIWCPSYWQALNFGAKRTYIEVLES